MLIRIDSSGIGKNGWGDYAVRFLLGGLITGLAGAIAAIYGPVVGGLFLAFPAILPASVTLIEKDERERKEKAGLAGSRRGRDAAALDAAGSALGSVGLAAFGAVIWLTIEPLGWLALLLATLSWCAVAFSLWYIRGRLRFTRQPARG
jgi:hypothetical protein